MQSLHFEEKFQFELKEVFDESLLMNVNFPGVYLFEINTSETSDSIDNWSLNFLTKWEDEKYKYYFVPNSRKGRIAMHSNLNAWFPIYIGRSKNISSRIKGHIYGKMNKPTGALKLMERKNLYGHKFKISTVKVEVANYDLIMPLIEKALRNRINPILGRQ